jgi:hypothetical protein
VSGGLSSAFSPSVISAISCSNPPTFVSKRGICRPLQSATPQHSIETPDFQAFPLLHFVDSKCNNATPTLGAAALRILSAREPKVRIGQGAQVPLPAPLIFVTRVYAFRSLSGFVTPILRSFGAKEDSVQNRQPGHLCSIEFLQTPEIPKCNTATCHLTHSIPNGSIVAPRPFKPQQSPFATALPVSFPHSVTSAISCSNPSSPFGPSGKVCTTETGS